MLVAKQNKCRPAISTIIFMSNTPELELKDASPQLYDKTITYFMENTVMTTSAQKSEPSRGFPSRSL